MPKEIQREKQAPVFIVLGSGGHTAEMCLILQALLKSNGSKKLYKPQRYLVASSDNTSRRKLTTAMESAGLEAPDPQAFIQVPRSREVGQSWLTSLFTTFWALLWSFWLVWREQPRLLVCNGPGTCVPFCAAVFLWRAVGRLSSHTKIVFIESFCRTRTLSLSGRLLLPLADVLVVQWSNLLLQYKHKSNVKYFGRLM